MRPGLSEEFGQAITLDDRSAEQSWLPVPLLVVSGALTVVFKGLPPESGAGDRYQALSHAVRVAQDPRLAALGQLGGLLVVESRKR